MGVRYYMKCPHCGFENIFGNWTNYVTQCVCGKWLAVVPSLKTVDHDIAIAIMEADDSE